MRWGGLRRSSNVDDRRGSFSGRGGLALGGGLGGVVIMLLYVFLGGDPSQLQQNMQQQQGTQTYQPTAAEDTLAKFTSVVLANTEDIWNELFREQGMTYEPSRLVLFTQSTESSCGFASAATGPFYCPGDKQVYIDLSFFEDMKNRFKAPGDFACAYVIAHEVGHHVQDLLGITGKVDQMRGQLSEKEFNKLSVKLELQADFLAGVWAHHAQAQFNILEAGDIEEALNAANAIGDDRLQKEAQGYVVPDAFTHGTSAQRMFWFKKGFESGDMRKGDTFGANDL